MTRVLFGAVLFVGWFASIAHRAETGEPNLTRLVEFAKYATPDGQLPDLYINGSDGKPGTAHYASEACLATSASALGSAQTAAFVRNQYVFTTSPLDRKLCLSSQDQLAAIRPRAPPSA